MDNLLFLIWLAAGVMNLVAGQYTVAVLCGLVCATQFELQIERRRITALQKEVDAIRYRPIKE